MINEFKNLIFFTTTRDVIQCKCKSTCHAARLDSALTWWKRPLPTANSYSLLMIIQVYMLVHTFKTQSEGRFGSTVLLINHFKYLGVWPVGIEIESHTVSFFNCSNMFDSTSRKQFWRTISGTILNAESFIYFQRPKYNWWIFIITFTKAYIS